MALSRAAAAAARKAAKNRGLKGNRAADGSMLSSEKMDLNWGTPDKPKPMTPKEIAYRDKLDDYTPDELRNEINIIESRLANAELEGNTALVIQLERQYDIAFDTLESFDELDMLRKIEIEDAANIEKG